MGPTGLATSCLLISTYFLESAAFCEKCWTELNYVGKATPGKSVRPIDRAAATPGNNWLGHPNLYMPEEQWMPYFPFVAGKNYNNVGAIDVGKAAFWVFCFIKGWIPKRKLMQTRLVREELKSHLVVSTPDEVNNWYQSNLGNVDKEQSWKELSRARVRLNRITVIKKVGLSRSCFTIYYTMRNPQIDLFNKERPHGTGWSEFEEDRLWQDVMKERALTEILYWEIKDTSEFMNNMALENADEKNFVRMWNAMYKDGETAEKICRNECGMDRQERFYKIDRLDYKTLTRANDYMRLHEALMSAQSWWSTFSFKTNEDEGKRYIIAWDNLEQYNIKSKQDYYYPIQPIFNRLWTMRLLLKMMDRNQKHYAVMCKKRAELIASTVKTKEEVEEEKFTQAIKRTELGMNFKFDK